MSIKLGIGETVVNVVHTLPTWAVRMKKGNVLEIDGSRAQGNARRRNGDCRRRPKRSSGDQ